MNFASSSLDTSFIVNLAAYNISKLTLSSALSRHHTFPLIRIAIRMVLLSPGPCLVTKHQISSCWGCFNNESELI